MVNHPDAVQKLVIPSVTDLICELEALETKSVTKYLDKYKVIVDQAYSHLTKLSEKITQAPLMVSMIYVSICSIILGSSY